MTPNDLLTVGKMQEFLTPLLSEIKTLKAIAASASDRILTVDEAAELVGYNRKTVISWIKEGKKDHRGRKVCLEAFEFTTGQYRISLNKLLAYGRVGQE